MSPFLALPGAQPAHGADEGVAAHYGDPVREQRLLAAGSAVVDLSNRGVIRLDGPDRLTWLDSLTSQRIHDLGAGKSAETLLLDPSGRVEHAIALVDDGTATWLVVEAAAAAPLMQFLTRMRFWKQVGIEDVSGAVAVLGAFSDLDEPGPDGPPFVWRDPWTAGAAGGATRAAMRPHPGESFPLRLVLVPRDRLQQLAGSVQPAGVDALEALRVAAWRPRAALEVDARTIPHELDWLRSAVHLNKGCYRGQETVAKVHNLGRPPRRLVQLDLDGSDSVLPSPGAPVLVDGAEVGTVTSVARHHEDGPIALAVIKRSVPEDVEVVVAAADGPVSAAQRSIVPAGAAPAVEVPRLPRLGRVVR